MPQDFPHLGLSETESKILFHLLSSGPRSAGIIAQNLKIKRTTVYSALEGLMSMQLVLKEKVGGKMIFSPVNTDLLPQILLNNAQSKFEKAKDEIEYLNSRLSNFKKQHSVSFGGFEIQRIQSTLDYLKLLDKHIFTKDFCAIWNPQASIYSEKIKSRVLRFLEKTAINRNHIRDIFPSGQKTSWYINNIKNKNHHYRIIPPGFTDARHQTDVADLILVEDLVIISLNVPDNESSLWIKSQPFENYMRWLFDTLWNSLPEGK